MQFSKNNTFNTICKSAVLGIGLSGTLVSSTILAQDGDMTFFITSAGPGKGADLGGLTGADAHCETLAVASGSKLTGWKAYLSVNAKIDRSSGNPLVIPGANGRAALGR